MQTTKAVINKNIIRFVISGGSAALIEFLVFSFLLVYFSLGISNVLSFTSGVLVSFLMNKIWVFGSRSNTLKEIGYYSFLSIVNVFFSTLMIYAMVNYFGIWQYLAKIIVMIIIATWNFFLYKKIIFKTDRTQTF